MTEIYASVLSEDIFESIDTRRWGHQSCMVFFGCFTHSRNRSPTALQRSSWAHIRLTLLVNYLLNRPTTEECRALFFEKFVSPHFFFLRVASVLFTGSACQCPPQNSGEPSYLEKLLCEAYLSMNLMPCAPHECTDNGGGAGGGEEDDEPPTSFLDFNSLWITIARLLSDLCLDESAAGGAVCEAVQSFLLRMLLHPHAGCYTLFANFVLPVFLTLCDVETQMAWVRQLCLLVSLPSLSSLCHFLSRLTSSLRA